MVYQTYTHKSSFFWDSDLTDERKGELIKWVKSLDKDKAKMLEDLLDDTRDAVRWDIPE